MLEIKDLSVKIEDTEQLILNKLNLTIPQGEVHAIMGPNGAGKSTLGNVIAGKDGYELTHGQILLNDTPLNEMDATERAQAGIFLTFQYPVELPGVNVAQFLRTCVNAQRKHQSLAELNGADFLKLAKSRMGALKIPQEFLKRDVNTGFSGGEKKRFEMLQLNMLEPQFAILDETDSGLDIDALRVVSDCVNEMRTAARSFLVITHYQRLLDYIQPDKVHILAEGRILQSGGPELALQLENEGYEGVMNAA